MEQPMGYPPIHLILNFSWNYNSFVKKKYIVEGLGSLPTIFLNFPTFKQLKNIFSLIGSVLILLKLFIVNISNFLTTFPRVYQSVKQWSCNHLKTSIVCYTKTQLSLKYNKVTCHFFVFLNCQTIFSAQMFLVLSLNKKTSLVPILKCFKNYSVQKGSSKFSLKCI